MSDTPVIGEKWWGNVVLDVRELDQEGWIVYKIPGSKSEKDFIVKVITPDHPRGISVQHAHFALDLYGKLKNDREAARKVFNGVIEVWHGESPNAVLDRLEGETDHLPGYDIEYFLIAYSWILDQEDINYDANDGSRSEQKQSLIDELFASVGVETVKDRNGSQLAVSLMCDIIGGEHPVEALRRAGLSIR